MAEGAGDDEVGVLGVEAGEQRLERRDVAGVGPVGNLGGDAVAREMFGQLSDERAQRALARDEKAKIVTFCAFAAAASRRGRRASPRGWRSRR